MLAFVACGCADMAVQWIAECDMFFTLCDGIKALDGTSLGTLNSMMPNLLDAA